MSSLSQRPAVRPRRRRWWWLLVVGAVLAAGTAAWWFLWPRPESPEVAGRALAAAWSRGELAAAPFRQTAPADLAARYETLVGDLDAGPPRVTLVAVSPPGEDEPETTRATLRASWDLGVGEPWTYETTAELRLAELTWRVVWDPALVHPRLEEGLRLARSRLRPDRGDVVGPGGTALVTERPVVEVGVQPSRTEDVAALTATLERVLDVDGAALADRVRGAPPDAFVPVITLREADYDSVRPRIHDLPGTVFRRDRIPLAPTRRFARALLGRVDRVTAEVLEDNPERYARGDLVGLSGLQARYDERLFGTPGLQVVLRGEEAPEDPVLFELPSIPGEDVTVTLDEAVQRAADEAVQGTGFPTALVVLRVSDGHVLAAANSTETSAFNLAFQGRVPPGSTFKIVTTAALLQEGLRVDETVGCPGAVAIGNHTITNAGDQVLGEIPFRTAFARSCNTAFAQLSRRLEPGALPDTASSFGLGRPPAIGVDAFGGDVPVPEGELERALAAIGQGRNVVSPLAMAGAAVTVARGSFLSPSLVLEPEPGDAPTEVEALDPAVATSLRELTRRVVTEGTGRRAAEVPGGPVHGKTGTAEYGDETPPRTHAWFVGYRGDLAFAVLVAETPDAGGGTTAAPIAARFLAALDGG